MSESITLTARVPISAPLDLECIAPDRLANLGESDIAKLPVWSGRQQQAVGDWFAVHGGGSANVRVVGDVRLASGLGTAMAAGRLTVDGDAGPRTGASMTGGAVEVHGSAGHDLGVAMSGGLIHVRGNAGDRVGGGETGASRGMTGGEIVVDGSVGAAAGVRMRRGLLFVGGNAGENVARNIIAGTVIVLGNVGAEPASGSKRGTLVVGGSVNVPATYRYACTYEPPHVRLVLTHLARRYGVTIDRRFIDRAYRRFCGDAGTVGRGEILWIT